MPLRRHRHHQKDTVGNDTTAKSRIVMYQVHEVNKSCTAKSHESIVIYIVNPHEFYIATKEEKEEAATAARRFYIATKEEEEAAAAWPCPGPLHP